MRFVARTLLALALVTSATPAFAQDVDEATKKQARDMAIEGQSAVDKGDFVRAEELFSRASQLYPKAPTLVLYLARAQVKQEKYAAAVENFERIVREWGEEKGLSVPFREAVDLAKAEVVVARQHIATVTIHVEGAKNPNVLLDGQKIPVAALGFKRSIDAGNHSIKVTADGMKPAERAFAIKSGEALEQTIVLESDGAAPSVAVAPTQPTPSVSAKSEPNRTPAYIAFGVGAAGLGVGAITGLMAMGKHSDLEKACPNKTCSADKASDVDSYTSLGTISTVGFIVGGVGIAAGAVFLFMPKKETGKAASVLPYVGPDGFGAVGKF